MTIPGVHSKDQPPMELKALALEWIDTCYDQESWIHAYTDGSATEATRNGGSGVFIRFPNSTTVHLSVPGGRRCSNYRAELLALKEAIEYFLSMDQVQGKIVFLTDSLSALQALDSDSSDVIEIITLLNRLTSRAPVTLQWVPAHVGIRGNEIADTLAKAGSQLPQIDTKLSFQETKTVLRRAFQEEWISSNKGYRAEQDPFRRLDRGQQTTIFRLRTGHCRLNYHANKIGLAPSATCPCNSSPQTPEHILQSCVLFETQRKDIWPVATPLETKLWGTTEDLQRTAQFIKAIAVRI